jgi:apolipoprotein N-acyltransferase
MSALRGWPGRFSAALHRLPLLDVVLTAAIGGLHSLPFVLTGSWGLQIAAAAWLAWRLSQVSVRRAAVLGLVFGTAWLASSVWWLFISMHRYGNLPAWMAGSAVGLLSLVLSVYLAAASAACARWRRGRPLPDALLFSALWLLAELARGVLFTGFPWVASGYAHVDGPLAVLAPWIGVYGVGAVAAFIAAWLVLRPAGRSRPMLVLVPTAVVLAGLFALAWVAGPVQFTQPVASLRVTLLQGNVPQDEKFSAEHVPAALAWTSEQLLGAQADLVLAPETVIPLLPDQLDPGYWRMLQAHFQAPGRGVLFGLPLGSYEQGYTNSAAGISAATKEAPGGFYRYDKHHLVPFGEFIPTGFRWFTEMMNLPLGDFNRGPLRAPSFPVADPQGTLVHVAPNICYEDLFGEELAARFTTDPLQPGAPLHPPEVFANISNIGWFGDTIAIDQHLHISRMRSLEFQRPMLRATNTGATVVIDHLGRVTHRLLPHTRGVLNATVQGRQGLTPFAHWASRFGLWPLGLAATSIVAVAVFTRRKARTGP